MRLPCPAPCAAACGDVFGVHSTGGGGGGWLLGLGLDAHGCSEGDWEKLQLLPGGGWGVGWLPRTFWGSLYVPIINRTLLFFFLTCDIITLSKVTKRGI